MEVCLNILQFTSSPASPTVLSYMYNGVGHTSYRGGTGSVHRSVATLVRSSKEDFVQWQESREAFESVERIIDPRIIAHKERRAELGKQLVIGNSNF